MQPLLQVQHIYKSFPGVKALSGVNLSVYSGKVMALIGENGAGKSTLMKVLTGIYKKDSGFIFYQGTEVNFSGPKASQKAGIGIIHQELNLIPELTVAENIYLSREFTHWGHINWDRTYQEADILLRKLNVNFNSKIRLGDLSLGQQQMVEIAKILSFDSKIIIMDEPTDALTDTETEALFHVIEELKAQGCGVVYISHRLNEIFTICDDVTVLRDGQFITEMPVAELNENRLIEMMVGRNLDKQYPCISISPGRCSLEIKHFEGHGIHDVSFHLHESEILGISGLIGAGRTELMKMIYGALSKRQGQLRLFGENIHIRSPEDSLKHGIVYISEDRKKDGLILSHSVKHNMSLMILKEFTNLIGKLNLKSEQTAVQRFIALFNIKAPSSKQTIGYLSGGNQQKVALAKGIMVNPKILILDEPTRGVDVGAKKEIYHLINQFKRNGLSVILVSSEMTEIIGMSDRVLIMHEGKIAAEYEKNEVTQEKLMAAAIGKNRDTLVCKQ